MINCFESSFVDGSFKVMHGTNAEDKVKRLLNRNAGTIDSVSTAVSSILTQYNYGPFEI